MKYKATPYNIIEPDIAKYRPAKPEDLKQPGDLFNIGKYEALDDKSKPDVYLHASGPNGIQFGTWAKFYLVQKERKIG